jgi:hypothetical protein
VGSFRISYALPTYHRCGVKRNNYAVMRTFHDIMSKVHDITSNSYDVISNDYDVTYMVHDIIRIANLSYMWCEEKRL